MSKQIKKLSLRFAFGVELILCLLFFAKSFKGINDMKTENLELVNKLDQAKKSVASLEQEIDEWNSDIFYKEQLAREKLQMADPNEEIYYI